MIIFYGKGTYTLRTVKKYIEIMDSNVMERWPRHTGKVAEPNMDQ